MIHIGYLDISTLTEQDYQTLYVRATPQRQKRADRYLRKDDSLRCIAADALLRYATRQALGTDRLPYSQTPEGKPFLPGDHSFHFNLSHSGRWVVIAWGDRPVGIDVETVAMDDGKEHLAHRFFHPEEKDHLFAAQGQERAQRFFEIWTRKESYLKYLGTGINRSLSSFSVLSLPTADVTFRSWFWEDAVVTLCAQSSGCQLFPITADMLLSG